MRNVNLRTTVMANRIMILRLANALGLSPEELDKMQDECTKVAEDEVNKMLEEMEKENEDNK